MGAMATAMMVRKTSLPAHVKILNANEGIFEALPAVSNIIDSVGDVIAPGAIGRSLAEIPRPKLCGNHQWQEGPIGRILEAEELLPGDARLPADLLERNAGALWVKGAFNMGTQRGSEGLSDLVFMREDACWSIAYAIPPDGQHRDKKSGANVLTDLKIFECSTVLIGANEEARTLSIKSAESALLARFKWWSDSEAYGDVRMPSDVLALLIAAEIAAA